MTIQEAINIVTNTSKAFLEQSQDIDSEKEAMIKEAIKICEYDRDRKTPDLEEARTKGYKHTFCSMGFKEEDNPYHPNSLEGEAWLSGYYEGIEAT